jgi:hypothetical protein
MRFSVETILELFHGFGSYEQVPKKCNGDNLAWHYRLTAYFRPSRLGAKTWFLSGIALHPQAANDRQRQTLST